MTPRWVVYDEPGGGGGGPWEPSQLSSLAAWYDADAITGLNNNDPVSTWADASGNGYDLTQTSNARPTYKTSTLNGLPVVEFDGTDDTLNAATASDWTFLHDSTGSSVFAVWKAGTSNDPDDAYTLCGSNGTSGNNRGVAIFYDDRSGLPRNDRVAVSVSSAGAFQVNQVSSDGFMSANAAHLLGVLNDPSNATAALRSSIRLNGGAAVENNTYTASPSSSAPTFTFQIGAAGNNVIPLLGYIAEVVICDAVLTSTDRQKVEGYLAHKWGLAGNLPVSHPYKNAAP